MVLVDVGDPIAPDPDRRAIGDTGEGRDRSLRVPLQVPDPQVGLVARGHLPGGKHAAGRRRRREATARNDETDGRARGAHQPDVGGRRRRGARRSGRCGGAWRGPRAGLTSRPGDEQLAVWRPGAVEHGAGVSQPALQAKTEVGAQIRGRDNRRDGRLDGREVDHHRRGRRLRPRRAGRLSRVRGGRDGPRLQAHGVGRVRGQRVIGDDHQVLAHPLLRHRGGRFDDHCLGDGVLVDRTAEWDHDRLRGCHVCLILDAPQVGRDHARRRLVLEIDLDPEHDKEAGRHRGHGRR